MFHGLAPGTAQTACMQPVKTAVWFWGSWGWGGEREFQVTGFLCPWWPEVLQVLQFPTITLAGSPLPNKPLLPRRAFVPRRPNKTEVVKRPLLSDFRYSVSAALTNPIREDVEMQIGSGWPMRHWDLLIITRSKGHPIQVGSWKAKESLVNNMYS